MSKESLNVVIAGCMLTVTIVYVYYSRKADREYRSTMDSLDELKNSYRWTIPSVPMGEPPQWTEDS